MLTIGEFSSICRVSTKTLRYYAEIGLILPEEINPENGYRYYSMKQLKTMLLINRLKEYHFSLEEIKAILESEERMDDKLYAALNKKKKEISMQVADCQPKRPPVPYSAATLELKWRSAKDTLNGQNFQL